MQLQLNFGKLEADVLDATAVVRVVDTQEVDGPAQVVSTFVSEKFNVLTHDSVVELDAIPGDCIGTAGLTLAIKVEGMLTSKSPVTFINTTEVDLPVSESVFLSISLTQI